MRRVEELGIMTAVVFVVLSAVSGIGAFKVAVIGWTAFTAMMVGGLAAERELDSAETLVWSYGLSGGAALASVMFFVLPQALSLSKEAGVLGILAGFLSGLALHTLSHELSHAHKGFNTLWSVTVHSLAAGLVIGLIYQQMPAASLLLGLAIVSHKLPAGYMIADRMKRDGRSHWKPLLLPAAGVGAAALLSFNLQLQLSQQLRAVFFGFSTGIFLHVALDFMPDAEPESHLRKLLHDTEDPMHEELDEIRFHSVLSTITGATVVAVLALLL